jgi:dihydroflavonol-4-reductase
MLAMQRGRRGERYILGGERIALPDYFKLIANICDRPAPRLTLPRWAVVGAATLFSAVEHVTARPGPFSLTQAWHLVGRYGWYSSEKAVNELGYGWRPVADAVHDYVTWVRAGRPSG